MPGCTYLVAVRQQRMQRRQRGEEQPAEQRWGRAPSALATATVEALPRVGQACEEDGEEAAVEGAKGRHLFGVCCGVGGVSLGTWAQSGPFRLTLWDATAPSTSIAACRASYMPPPPPPSRCNCGGGSARRRARRRKEGGAGLLLLLLLLLQLLLLLLPLSPLSSA